MKPITRYSLPNPVNVKDPRTDGYTVVVHPCQEIVLSLTDPNKLFSTAAADDEWEVKAFSDYFYLNSMSDSAGKKHFSFVQFYDMTPWTEHSSVYIGDIEISVNGKAVSENFTLCVIARSAGRKQSRIITAVNPVVNRIKLDLDEILEVVVTKDDAKKPNEEVWCSLYDMGRSGTGNGSQWFERVRQETIILPDSMPQPRDDNNLYLTMSRSVSALRKNPGLPADRPLPSHSGHEVQSQHHFWFRVRPEDKAAVLRANTGQPMANVVFNGTSGSCSNLQVLVSTRGSRSVPDVPEYDKERYEGRFRGLIGRHFCQSSGLLINPGKVEGVEMTPSQGGVMIELAPPQMTWPYTDPKYRWQCDVEPVVSSENGSTMQSKRVICTELIDRSINQQAIQRFFIKPECELPDGEQMFYLGVVNLWCKEPSVIGKRTINCWLVRQRSVADEHDCPTEDRYKSILVPNSLKQRGTVPARSTPPPSRRPLVLAPQTPPSRRPLVLAPQTPPVKYDRVVVRITEHRDDSMTAPGSTTVSFQNIKIEKRDACVVGYTVEEYDRYAGMNQKKNEKVISSPSNNSQNASESRKRRSPGGSLSPQFSGGSGSVGGGPGDNVRLVVDPEEHTLIRVTPGQDVAIRLPVKTWDTKEDIGFFWTFNPIQLRHNQFFIKSQQMVRDGRRLFQEVVVSLLPRNGPREIGTFVLGGIQCRNQHETRYVAIQLAIENLTFSDSNPDYHKSLRALMQSLKVSRAANQLREIKEAKDGVHAAIAALHGEVKAEKKKRGLIHDPKMLASLTAAFSDAARMNDEQQQQVARRAEEEAECFRQSRPAKTCKVIRNPTGGEAFDLGSRDTLKITLNDKITTVACRNTNTNAITETPWQCCGHPEWLTLTETIMYKGEKSFIFQMDGKTKYPVLDEIQLKCGTDIRVIRVRYTCDDFPLTPMGS